jgi:hypothetical protein
MPKMKGTVVEQAIHESEPKPFLTEEDAKRISRALREHVLENELTAQTVFDREFIKLQYQRLKKETWNGYIEAYDKSFTSWLMFVFGKERV